MSIPRRFYISSISSQILEMMYEDLSDVLEFNPLEPIFVGRPIYVSNYPCLIALPTTDGSSIIPIGSPYIAETRIAHTITYLYKGKTAEQGGFIDPSIQSSVYGEYMLDWLAYASANYRLPLKDTDGENVDTNWAVHCYERPWELMINNQYQDDLRTRFREENLFAPCVQFRTLIRERVG